MTPIDPSGFANRSFQADRHKVQCGVRFWPVSIRSYECGFSNRQTGRVCHDRDRPCKGQMTFPIDALYRIKRRHAMARLRNRLRVGKGEREIALTRMNLSCFPVFNLFRVPVQCQFRLVHLDSDIETYKKWGRVESSIHGRVENRHLG